MYAIIFSNILETYAKADIAPAEFRSGSVSSPVMILLSCLMMIHCRSNFWSLMFLLLAVGAFLVNFLEIGFSGLGGERLSKRLRIKSFHCILRQEIGFFDDPHYSTGILTAKLATDATMVHSKSLYSDFQCQNNALPPYQRSSCSPGNNDFQNDIYSGCWSGYRVLLRMETYVGYSDYLATDCSFRRVSNACFEGVITFECCYVLFLRISW
jgi:ABC-type multidrug transport system fused ATPase/permease subunit